MKILILLITLICVFSLAYRYYAAFIAAKVLVLDNKKITPSVSRNDGSDYVPTNKWIVFGQHFAAIAGAGPLIGPALAAQFGWGPGFFWILIGSVFAGGVHDMVILTASIRHNGESIANIAKSEISSMTGFITAILTFFIIIITLAGVGIAVVNILYNNPWGVFSIFMTIPIAMVVGIYIFRIKGSIIIGSLVGIGLVCLAVFSGSYVVSSNIGTWLSFNKETLSIILPVYTFFIMVLPVWLLLTPRGYLSTYMKIGVIVLLAVSLFFVRPEIRLPFTTEFISGNGPIINGPWWPYVFITIACGAISGFHALISTGTTPRIIEKKSHIPLIGYGAMLAEGFVAAMALLVVATLIPADYFAINTTKDVFEKLNMAIVELPELNTMVGIDAAHRPGGGVSLAVGMAHIFSGVAAWLIPTMKYWFQFIIMFEALFILTLIDSGARVARYILQNILGTIWSPLKESNSLLYRITLSIVVSLIWGYLLYTGNISSIWPLFGTTNQILASLALAIGTAVVIKSCKKKSYALVTIIPCVFIFITAIQASIMNIKTYYMNGQILNIWLCVALIIMSGIIMFDSVRTWIVLLKKRHSKLVINSATVFYSASLNCRDML
ncbi:Peptide transporter CstA [Gammaproteobacteria bacterium]